MLTESDARQIAIVAIASVGSTGCKLLARRLPSDTTPDDLAQIMKAIKAYPGSPKTVTAAQEILTRICPPKK